MMFCCCTEATEGANAVAVKDNAYGTTEGAVFPTNTVVQSQGILPSRGNDIDRTPAMPTIPDSARSKDSKGPNSGQSLSPEEKEKEKARLQLVVNGFVRTAAKGCPCTYLKEGTGERCQTRYYLDKRLEHLVVVAPGDTTVAEVRCPIGAIQDIYCFMEDGAKCFPSKVVGLLNPAEQQLLLMVVYRSDRGGTHRFCLLEDSVQSRDTFLECIRILCIYMQTTTNSGNAPSNMAASQIVT